MINYLNYFEIDGAFGGSQDWFKNVVMCMGGCAAATACDSCIYFARERGMDELYPYDKQNLKKSEYGNFAMVMKPYLRPRMSGINRLELYIEGFGHYLEDRGSNITMNALRGDRSIVEVKETIKNQIDKGIPIPYLMLKHQKREVYKDYIWHWFLLVGYEEIDDEFIVCTATYGKARKFPIEEMWDTGYEEKGGIIIYSLDN